jgi:hypothetical protein
MGQLGIYLQVVTDPLARRLIAPLCGVCWGRLINLSELRKIPHERRRSTYCAGIQTIGQERCVCCCGGKAVNGAGSGQRSRAGGEGHAVQNERVWLSRPGETPYRVCLHCRGDGTQISHQGSVPVGEWFFFFFFWFVLVQLRWTSGLCPFRREGKI